MSILPVETRQTMILNVVLLFNIIRSGNSSVPSSPQLIETASSLYVIDLGVMMLVMGVFTLALASEEKRLVPANMITQLKGEASTWILAAGIFVVSAVPIFGRIVLGDILVIALSLRMVLWLSAALVIWVRRGGKGTPGHIS